VVNPGGLKRMESMMYCRCGEKVTGFISGVGWLCKECFDKELKENSSKSAQNYILKRDNVFGKNH